jgi:hypothetical protein
MCGCPVVAVRRRSRLSTCRRAEPSENRDGVPFGVVGLVAEPECFGIVVADRAFAGGGGLMLGGRDPQLSHRLLEGRNVPVRCWQVSKRGRCPEEDACFVLLVTRIDKVVFRGCRKGAAPILCEPRADLVCLGDPRRQLHALWSRGSAGTYARCLTRCRNSRALHGLLATAMPTSRRRNNRRGRKRYRESTKSASSRCSCECRPGSSGIRRTHCVTTTKPLENCGRHHSREVRSTCVGWGRASSDKLSDFS